MLFTLLINDKIPLNITKMNNIFYTILKYEKMKEAKYIYLYLYEAKNTRHCEK